MIGPETIRNGVARTARWAPHWDRSPAAAAGASYAPRYDIQKSIWPALTRSSRLTPLTPSSTAIDS